MNSVECQDCGYDARDLNSDRAGMILPNVPVYVTFQSSRGHQGDVKIIRTKLSQSISDIVYDRDREGKKMNCGQCGSTNVKLRVQIDEEMEDMELSAIENISEEDVSLMSKNAPAIKVDHSSVDDILSGSFIKQSNPVKRDLQKVGKIVIGGNK